MPPASPPPSSEPPPPPADSTGSPQADVCPNVPGDQASGPCADVECSTSGGTWNSDSCLFPVVDLTASSTSSTDSAEVLPEESDTDNTDFADIGTPPDPNAPDNRPLVDLSATTTEMAAIDPQFIVANDNDGTGSKIGGTIFTGNATASTTVKNVLNITRANVDGPGVTNSSHITADTDNEAILATADETRAFTGQNKALGGEGTATIGTGKAVASAEVMNVVNTNLFNSNGMVLFLNPLNGDGFDLRNFDLSYFFDEGPGSSPTQYGCTILTCLNSSNLSILNKNVAEVTNNVEVRAETGANTATSTLQGDVDVTTGNAYAVANVLNLVNTNFINSSYLVLSMNNFGDLNDDIVLPGASFFEQLLASGNSLPDMNSSSYVVNNDNDEDFFGTTTANAITGENVATTTGTAFGSGEIHTGNAYTSTNSFTAANQTRVGGSSVLLSFRVWGQWSGSVQGLPGGMTWHATRAADDRSWLIEIISTGGGSGAGGAGVYNSSDFLASSTNKANVKTDVNVWAVTGQNVAETEDGVGRITTGDAYAAANVINMVNTNIVGRNWIFGSFNIFGDWSGDISFGGSSPDLRVDTRVDAPASIPPDSEVTYRFSVTNNGDVGASGVVLRTQYDKNLLILTRSNFVGANTAEGMQWSLGTIPSHGSKEVVVTARVRARDLPAGTKISIPLNAIVESGEHDQNDADNEDGIAIQVTAPGQSNGGTSEDTGGSGPGDNGGGSPPPSDNSGGSPPPSGGGNNNPPPSGGGNPGPSGGGNNNPAPSGGGNPAPSGGGSPAVSGGGGGGGGGSGAGGTVLAPLISIKKTHVVSAGTAPALVDYKVVVFNEKYAGPAYKGVLTDTLYSPSGKVMSNRSWDLDAVAPGDEITLTYSVEFAASTAPGTYYNVARVTGTLSPTASGVYPPMNPIEVRDTVVFAANGSVLGAATSTPVFNISTSTLKVASTAAPSSCTPLLSANLKPGSPNKADVLKLQIFLNTQGSKLPTTGFFGPMTSVAVKSFQRTYAAEILTPVGLSSPTGLVYASTIRKINKVVCGGAVPTPGTPSQVSVPASPTASAAAAASASTQVSPAPAKPKAPVKPKAAAPAKVEQPKTGGTLFGSFGGLFSNLVPKTANPGR